MYWKKELTGWLLVFFLLNIFTVNTFSENSLSSTAVEFIKNGQFSARLTNSSPREYNKTLVAFDYENNGNKGRILINKSKDAPEHNRVVFFSDHINVGSSEMPIQLESLLADIDKSFSSGSNSFTSSSLSKSLAAAISDSAGPLITTKWSQNWPYNSRCPEDNGITKAELKKHASAGCAAIAMAQIMKYHHYPIHGTGTLTYSDNYGSHQADFGKTTYQWNDMPDTLTSSSSENMISAVSTLIYHCGVSLETQYGPDQSGASFDSVKNAYLNHFNYSPSIMQRDKLPFETVDEWKNILTSEIDHKRPVFFMANGTISHGFIIDGYKHVGSTLFFHINWGWGGNYDGYFNIDYLTVGSYTLDTRHQAYLFITPPSLIPPPNLRLVLNPYPPVAAWSPVPGAVGYFFEFHMNQTSSLGPIMKGPDSTTTDIRIVYNTPKGDTFFFKVCSIDSTGGYSNWSYLNIVNNGQYVTPIDTKKSSTPQSIGQDISVSYHDNKYIITLSLSLVGDGQPKVTLYSAQGKKISLAKNLNRTTYIFDYSIVPGLYILRVESAGKQIFGKAMNTVVRIQ